MEKKASAKKTKQLWAVVNKKTGLSTGTFLSRQDAIFKRCLDFGALWEERMKEGDAVVRVTVTWKEPVWSRLSVN